MTIDKHTLALISIVGSSLDVLGALSLPTIFWAGARPPEDSYQRSHLRRTRRRGQRPLPRISFWASGAVTGLIIALEFSRASRHGPKPGFWYDVTMSAVRGAGYALDAAYLYGRIFGATFGVLSMVGQAIAYQVGIRPTIDYQPVARPRLTRHQLLAALNRSVGYAFAGYVSALLAHQRVRAASIGLKTGLMIGVVTAVLSASTSAVEWGVEHVPQKGMGSSELASF